MGSTEPVDAPGGARPDGPAAGGLAPAAVRPLARVLRPVVWCEPGEPVREVAGRIGAAGQSCALLRTGEGLGIVTDHDFRARVATGEVPVDAPAAALATVPALTIDVAAPQSTALLRMLEHGVHHLVVTGDGGRPVGVVRVADLAQAEVRDPLLVRAAVERAGTLDELAEACRELPDMIVELRAARVAATHVGAVHAAVVDAVVRRIPVLAPDQVFAGVRHSWLVLGSLARRESLPLSDVDTALVWEGGAELGGPLRAAAGRVLAALRGCGLEPCPNGTNADDPRFARSRDDWVAAVRSWRRDPTAPDALLMSSMVADSRPLTEPPLGRELTGPLRSRTRTTQFLRALLDDALGWRPPTGFVRDFVVQHSGEHRGQLDLKSGGLAPVVSLARWAGIVTGEPAGSTPERLRRGADAGLLTADESDTLAGAFEAVYALLLDHEVRAIRAGELPTTYIAPARLDTLTRRHLRESFRAIAAVQDRVAQAWTHRLPD